jgi:hypothetical protein
MPAVMLDLETLGTNPGCVIRSIGAVTFDPRGDDLGMGLHIVIDRASCEAVGLTVDPATEAWWSTQSPEAQAAFDLPAVSLADALDTFDAFFAEAGREPGSDLADMMTPTDLLWAHGPSFDETILAAAYRALDRKPPWRYNAARCTRTIYDAAGIGLVHSSGTHHNALDDATTQALAVQEAYGKLGLSKTPKSVVQGWVSRIPLMQQTVLLTAIRGPDGSPKYGPTKLLVRWLRRCVLLGSFERRPFKTPYDVGGGSFTGPSMPRNAVELILATRGGSQTYDPRRDFLPAGHPHRPSDEAIAAEFERVDGDWTPYMNGVVDQYLRELDALPHHFQLHLMHAVEILGYKHPDERVRGWWFKTYERLAHDMHLWPETEAQLDQRLGDSREGWLARNDAATVD